MHRSRLLPSAIMLATVALAGPIGAQQLGGPAGISLEQIVQTRTVGQFSISPDGRSVAYTLSGYYLQFPVIPQFGEDNNIHVVDLETGQITQVTSGHRPKTRPLFSPSGRYLAFEADDDIWVVDLASGRTRPLTMTIFQARNSQPTWSPDESRLAFISNRGGYTDLWVTGAAGDRHGAIQLTNDAVAESDPQWSPDGRLIAFTAKVPGEHYMATSIFTIPAAGGAVVRLTPADGVDNFAPRFSPDGRTLAFLSDRSGYVQPWIMSRDGSGTRSFDTGPHDAMSPYWNVQPVWSPDGNAILVSFNTEGHFRLAQIDVASGRVHLVGSEPGHYHEVGWAADGSLVYSYENAWSPPALYVQQPSRTRARRLTHTSHATFHKGFFAETRPVSFRAADGFDVPGFLMTPADLPPSDRRPAIVLMHPNSYGQSYRDNWNPFPHYLVQHGYIVLMVNHRGGAGYGRAFREMLFGNWGTGTLEDVKAGAAYVRSLPFVDEERVGIMGLSVGGYHTLLALTKEPGLFQAGVDLMGITDLRSPFSPYRVSVSETDAPELYQRISPITTADRLRDPLLIIHSDQDRNVVPQQTYHLIDELDRLGKPYDARMYYGEAHGLAKPANQLDSYERIVAFFDQHLRRSPPQARSGADRHESARRP